jgi:hypothetical protein
MQEALFQLQLQQAEAGAKHCTGPVGSQGQVLGQDPPSPSTVKRLKAARQAALDQHNRDTQEAATHRCVADPAVWNMDACACCNQVQRRDYTERLINDAACLVARSSSAAQTVM